VSRRWQDLVGGLEVDRELVAKLHDEVAPRLNAQVAARQAGGAGALSFADEKALGRHVIREVLAEWRAAAYRTGDEPLDAAYESALARAVHDEIYGLGRVQVFVDHPDVVDLHVPGSDPIFLTLTDGSKIRGPSVADSDGELNALVSRQARRAGRSERRFDREEVDLDLRLANGARLHALREVTGRTVVDIRQHRWEIASLDQLVDCDEIDMALAGFLATAVRARFNVVVAGGMAAGKTTLLRCLINEIPSEERIITVEDSLELGIERFAGRHPDHESIEARRPNSEGKGAFTLSDALRSSLRMMDSTGGRVIVGEARGYEVIPMLKAMTQGNDGSMCTVHASSARDALWRLQLYALDSPQRLPSDVSAAYIAAGVHFVVFLEMVDGVRRVKSVVEVSHADGTAVAVNEVWKPDFAGRAIPGARLREGTEHRLVAAGFDAGLLDKPNGWWRR
jgi:Flp pilus assembly CpaF family ATPase